MESFLIYRIELCGVYGDFFPIERAYLDSELLSLLGEARYLFQPWGYGNI